MLLPSAKTDLSQDIGALKGQTGTTGKSHQLQTPLGGG